MKVQIFSRKMAAAKEIHNNIVEPHIWISIRDKGKHKVKFPDNPHRLNQIFLQFDDVEEEGTLWYGRELKPISQSQAKKIADFVNQHKDTVDLVCVNCEAGISRSAGVAEAISLALNGHDSGIRDNHSYYPNTCCKTRVMRAFRGDTEG